jgi:hypothetical protein
MDNLGNKYIEELAYGLWQSAGRPYWVALDFWLMAEQMAVQMAIDASNKSSRRRESAR